MSLGHSPNRSTCCAREKQKTNYAAKTTVTRLSVLNTNVGSQSASSVVLPLFLISSPSRNREGCRMVNTRLSTREISGWSGEEWDISFLEVLDSLANWGSTQWRESGFSKSTEKPFTTTDLVPAGALNSDVAMVPHNA